MLAVVLNTGLPLARENTVKIGDVRWEKRHGLHRGAMMVSILPSEGFPIPV